MIPRNSTIVAAAIGNYPLRYIEARLQSIRTPNNQRNAFA